MFVKSLIIALTFALVTVGAGRAVLADSADVKADPHIAARFAFTKVVDTNTIVPGGGGAHFGLSLFTKPTVSGSNVVFPTTAAEIWTATTSGTRKRRVIKSSMSIPHGGGAKFHFDEGAFVQIYGGTVVLGGKDCDGCDTGFGIYTVPVSGGPRARLVDVNEFLPGSTTRKFSRFGSDFYVNSNFVVFANAQRIFAVPLSGGPAKYVADGVGVDYIFFAGPTLNAAGSHVFVAAHNFGDINQLQEYGRTGLLLQVIASGTDHAPHKPVGYHFDAFHRSFDLLVIDETSAHTYFVFKAESFASSLPRIVGIYSRESAGFKRLVDTNTFVPGGTGKFAPAGFVAPGGGSLAAANGVVVFQGVDAAGKLGIFAVLASGGPITKIIAQGDPIKGFTVDTGEPLSLGFLRGSFDGTTLVFLAQYAGAKGIGIYSTRVVLP